jgi:hypothetical protein
MSRYGTGSPAGIGHIKNQTRPFEVVVEQLDAQESAQNTKISVLLVSWRVYQPAAAPSR